MAVQSEAGLGDAIRETAERRAEVAAVALVFLSRIKAENDVAALTMAIRSHERLDGCTQGDDSHAYAGGIRERYRLDRAAVVKRAEWLSHRLGGERRVRQQQDGEEDMLSLHYRHRKSSGITF